MKRTILAVAVAALAVSVSACATKAPNDAPVNPTNSLQFGGLPWKASGQPIASGNGTAIPSGQAGDGGGAAAAAQ